MKHFTDYTHKNQFRLIRAQLPAGKRNDIKLLSIVYLMAGSEIFKNNVSQFFNWKDGDFDWSKMLEENAENDAKLNFFKLSAELYTQKQMISIKELISLEKAEFDLVMMLLRNLNEGLNLDTYDVNSFDNFFREV